MHKTGQFVSTVVQMHNRQTCPDRYVVLTGWDVLLIMIMLGVRAKHNEAW